MLVCPGDQWTPEVPERALDLGLQLVGSYYLAMRQGDRFCWTQHVCAPYLNEPNPAWFDAGLPVVGYFHDRELALEGVDWISRWLDRWQAAGATRLMDFRELATAVCCRLQLAERDNALRLTLTSEAAPALVRPLTIALRLPDGRPPARLTVSRDGRDLSLQVQPLNAGQGRVMLPPQEV
jgi:hypothetical protein